MRKLLTLALIVAASAQSSADIYGVKLVSYVPATSTSGSGMVNQMGGVTGAGLVASINDLASASGAFGSDYKTSVASVSVTLQMDVFWLKTSSTDGPPSSLYLNVWRSGTVSGTASYSAPGSSSGVGQVSLSATPASTSAGRGNPGSSTVVFGPGTDSHGDSKFDKPYYQPSLTWDYVGLVDGLELYKTHSPVQYATPTVMASGSVSASANWAGYYTQSTAQGAAAGGYGYFVATAHWP